MDAAAHARHLPPMPTLHLEDEELRDAAQAARLASVETEIEADKQVSATARAMYDSAARRYRELADKFERARVRRG
jgi:chromosome segregation ATPase